MNKFILSFACLEIGHVADKNNFIFFCNSQIILLTGNRTDTCKSNHIASVVFFIIE